MLEARPLRNQAARLETSGRGVVVYVRQQRPPALARPPLSWIVPYREESCSTLDALGTEVWNLCDGRRTVESIVDTFKDCHGLSFHEARVAVTEYLRVLVQRGVLAVALRDKP
jgi:hypothetical protein